MKPKIVLIRLLSYLAICAGIPWVACMGYMLFWLGPHAGWISDEFFRVERMSFLLLPAFLLGPTIGIAWLVDFRDLYDDEVAQNDN